MPGAKGRMRLIRSLVMGHMVKYPQPGQTRLLSRLFLSMLAYGVRCFVSGEPKKGNELQRRIGARPVKLSDLIAVDTQSGMVGPGPECVGVTNCEQRESILRPGQSMDDGWARRHPGSQQNRKGRVVMHLLAGSPVGTRVHTNDRTGGYQMKLCRCMRHLMLFLGR